MTMSFRLVRNPRPSYADLSGRFSADETSRDRGDGTSLVLRGHPEQSYSAPSCFFFSQTPDVLALIARRLARSMDNLRNGRDDKMRTPASTHTTVMSRRKPILGRLIVRRVKLNSPTWISLEELTNLHFLATGIDSL